MRPEDSALKGTPTRRDARWRALVGVAALLYGGAVLRTAWLADDPFVTFRAVDNLLRGHGFVSNPPERVMGFSNPLWALTVLVPRAFGLPIYWAAMGVSLACSAATAFLVAGRAARGASSAALVLLWLALSSAFVDYSTSGLENPLAHLLLALFFLRVLGSPSWTSPVPWALAALVGVNRLDHLLLVLPALATAFVGPAPIPALARPRGPLARAALVGGLPLVLWLAFALVYYGFPLPNTAYAKLNTRIASAVLAGRGLLYLRDALVHDPPTPFLLALAVLSAAFERTRRGAAVALGLLLYLAYVVRIGGDYMAGRFLSAPFAVAVVWLAVAFLPRRTPRQMLLLVGMTVPLVLRLPTTTAGSDKIECVVDATGIVSERRCYAEYTALARNLAAPKYRTHQYYRKGVGYRRAHRRVVVDGLPGMGAYAAGPRVHMIDLFALTDPLLARIPYDPRGTFRIGHFIRDVPEGYFETIVTGRNEIQNPCVRRYYDVLAPVIRGPLFTRKRWANIAALNLGAYDDLVHRPCAL